MVGWDANLSPVQFRVGLTLSALGGIRDQLGPLLPVSLWRKAGVHARKLTASPR